MVQLEPRGAASIAELGLAALGFVSLSAGAALASLGAHVFDRIEISSRWAPAAIVEPAVVRLSHDELLSRFGLRAAAGSRDRLALPS